MYRIEFDPLRDELVKEILILFKLDYEDHEGDLAQCLYDMVEKTLSAADDIEKYKYTETIRKMSIEIFKLNNKIGELRVCK